MSERASKRELAAAAAAYDVYFSYYGTAPPWGSLKQSVQMVWVRIARAALSPAPPASVQRRG